MFSISSDCNNKAHAINVNGVSIYVSYETAIAFRYRGMSFRRDNIWGRTTGKHMRELGVSGYPVIDDEKEFNKLLHRAILRSFTDDVSDKLAGEVAHVMG